MADEPLPASAAGSDDQAGSASAPVPVPARHTTIEHRRRVVAESLQVGNLGNNARDLPAQADPTHECQIVLSVEDIRPYEHNPRRANNARFGDIKASIRASGLRNPFTVTRRPGDAHFVVEAGGNTRLLAIRQLWAETREPRFHMLTVLFRPWRSESHVLTAHLIENDQRGDMSFWDKASGVVALKARLEAEKGVTLSLRQLEEEMKALGLAINTATLAHYLFAAERLASLGAVVSDLSGLDVKTMQPRLNALKRYAQTKVSLADDDLYAEVFEPVFRRMADEHRRKSNFSTAAVCRACEEAVAALIGEPVGQLRIALDPTARAPQRESGPSGSRGVAAPSAEEGAAPNAIGPSRSPEPTVSTANAKTGTARRKDRGRDPPPSADDGPAGHSRIIEQVRLCAGLAGFGDCLRVDADTGLGYRMDALPDSVPGESASRGRQWAWQLLALVFGAESRTLSEPAAEGGSADADTSPTAPTQSPDALVFDAAFIAWLVDSADQTAAACWDLLALVRASRSASPPSDIPVGRVPAAEDA